MSSMMSNLLWTRAEPSPGLLEYVRPKVIRVQTRAVISDQTIFMLAMHPSCVDPSDICWIVTIDNAHSLPDYLQCVI